MQYEKPMIEVEELDKEDIIRTSGEDGNDDGWGIPF